MSVNIEIAADAPEEHYAEKTDNNITGVSSDVMDGRIRAN